MRWRAVHGAERDAAGEWSWASPLALGAVVLAGCCLGFESPRPMR